MRGEQLRVTGGHREGLGTVRLPVTSRLTHTVTGPFLCLAVTKAYFVAILGTSLWFVFRTLAFTLAYHT